MRKAILALLLALLSVVPLHGQPKKDVPRIRLVLPLGAVAGKTTHLIIRGQQLDKATAVRCSERKAAVKIMRKGKATVPNKVKAEAVGDTQIEADIQLPAETRGDAVQLTVISPAGTSPPQQLFIDRPGGVLAEKEPNDGFRQAQAIPVPGVVSGTIEHPQDVDVYRMDGKAGQKLTLEVRAARYGSALDSLLTVYDAAGRELAANDDANGSRDSRLELVLPRTGKYYAVVMDANDLGSPLHVYRLHARWNK